MKIHLRLRHYTQTAKDPKQHGLHPGSRLPRATDLGPEEHALGVTPWESILSGYRFWIWESTLGDSTLWESTPWESTPSGYQFWLWESTLWESTLWNSTPWESTPSGYRFWIWGSTLWESTLWESTPWESPPVGYLFWIWGSVHSGSLHPGSPLPRATDCGSGGAHACH